MTTSANQTSTSEAQQGSNESSPLTADGRIQRNQSRITAYLGRWLEVPLLREFLIILAFCLLTSFMTWPLVSRLRDAVPGPTDPYLIAWSMWWDYHQTINDPLHLFHANAFYPYRYSLAFSETCYGVSLLFFPLYAIGLRPLTVHAVATFFAFALSGYGAFRLMRTLTGSSKAAWVAGIIFGFGPYRFNMLAQLMYLFSVWVPLLFEALILFVRGRTWKRAAWLGFAFFMTGLTTITWLLLSLIPFVLLAAIFLTRYNIWADRKFWWRSGVAVSLAGLALLPFTIPFYIVSKLYGFKRSVDDVRTHSALPIHWVVGEPRSKIWRHMGENVPEAWKFQMFPGLLPLIFPLAGLLLVGRKGVPPSVDNKTMRWVRRLDLLTVILIPIGLLSIGFNESNARLRVFFTHVSPERVFTLLVVVVIARLCISFPAFLHRNESVNLIQTIRRGSDAFWSGIVLLIVGFIYSIGWHFFLYRLLYDLMPGFKAIRAPMRGAMFALLGLSILSGLAIKSFAETLSTSRRLSPTLVYVIACLLLIVELNGIPLYFIRGEVFPDAVTLRLKQTSMNGGIVYFPANSGVNQTYMLRAADHLKPLILGTSGFGPPYVNDIERMTAQDRIPMDLLDLLEKIPASYLVVENRFIEEKRKEAFEVFLGRAVATGRLRFINRFEPKSDLYAITRTEPAAVSEAALPDGLGIQDWAGKLKEDSSSAITHPRPWAQKLYRAHIVALKAMPRYKDFMHDLEQISRNVIVGSEEQDQRFLDNFRRFLEEWLKRDELRQTLGRLNDQQYVDRLLENAAIPSDLELRKDLIESLSTGRETRAGTLLKILDYPAVVESQEYPSLVVLHYFAFLHRNPSDPPDGDLRGYEFWLGDLQRNHDPSKLAVAFRNAGEYKQSKRTVEVSDH